MPLAWDVKAARLEVAEPAVPEDIRVLADYHQEPASLVMWSGATPAGAITAEVVELKPPTMKQLKRIDVKNRMVLTEPPPTLSQRGALKASLYKLGAPVIPGSDPGEEVLEVGHVFELGAQDNSTGVAAMLEAVTPSR